MDGKPHVVFFSNQQQTIDLVTAQLDEQFRITPVKGMTNVEDALEVLRQVQPDYVIIDPLLSTLDHQQLHSMIKNDPYLKGVQILLIRDDRLA
jgi:CheY-like chemotaxis protein